MRLHSEEQVCPRRKNLYTPERVLSGGQSERGGHRFWDTEQRERDPASRGNSCIASEPKRPVEAVMCALRTGQGCRDRICAGREPLLLLDVHALITKQLDARPSVMQTTPVIPEERLISNHEWMQQHAHLARLFGGAPIPLALLTQLTGTTTANAGGVHQPQAPSASCRRSWSVSVLPAGQRRVPSGWSGKSWPVKRPVFQDVAVVGGPYPEAEVGAVGRVAACAFCSGMAGANSVMRGGVGSSLRFQTH